ncbi:MAG: glycosyltransferase family 4 protein [Candidatus Hodarchaeota archaeon]
MVDNIMKIALFYYDSFKTEGGISHVLECLIKTFKKTDHKIYLFNLNYRSKFTFELIEKRNSSQLIKILKKKNFYRFLFISFLKIIKDKQIPFLDRLRLLLYFVVKPNILLNTINNIIHIYPLIKKIDVDLILGGATCGDTLTLIFTISRILNKKVASLTYGNDFLVHSPLSLRTFYIRNLDLIIFGTHSLKRIFKKIHPVKDSRLKVIRYGLILKNYKITKDKEELRQELNIPKDKFILLSVGRHVPRKNFDLVIRAIHHIKQQKPDIKIKYYLIGSGPETPHLRELTKELYLEDEVQFLGFVDKNTRNKYYKISDVFTMPSTIKRESIEGFGIVFLEANYYKIPVIGTLSGGIIEAIIDGKTGFLIKPNDINELIEKILYFYENPEKRKKIGNQGYERVINEFNWNKIIFEYISHFQNLLKEI